MNAFTEMRKSYFEKMGAVSFPEYFLENQCYLNDRDDAARISLRDKIAEIRVLSMGEHASDEAIIPVLSALGEDLYLDRYIVELVVKHKAQVVGGRLQVVLLTMLCDPGNTVQRLAHLLDICMECNVPLLNGDSLQKVYLQYGHDLDALSILIEYMRYFSIDGFADSLYASLNEDFPENIKMQMIDYLAACSPQKANIRRLIKRKLIFDKHLKLYLSYLKFMTKEAYFKEAGLVVVQSMFYGDPEFSGKGQSGGLGTLLRTLGNQLVKHVQISQVITLTINNDWQEHKPFMSHYDNEHWLIRLPVYLNREDPLVFVRKELSIKRAVARFLKQWHINPDVFHVRYLDNASKAIALLSQEMKAKLVFTLTPDPHRNMVNGDGHVQCFKVEETLDKLNKISIGDELLGMTDGIVGIGGDAVRRELELYFPQLTHNKGRFDFKMIGEGINTEVDMQNFDLWQQLERHGGRFSIDVVNREKPIILNVGRLSSLKGQDKLIKVWGESQLWRDFNLVIIGGNRENPSPEELGITSYFEAYMDLNPHLKGRFAHAEALPNEVIRQVERKIMENKPPAYPNIYLCSSLKEEFGISIIEALSEGFLVFAPIKGGVRTYLVNGVNGFLIDTSTWYTLLSDVEKVVYHTKRSCEDFELIQKKGQQTVLDHFSIEEIAKHFLSFYVGVSEDDELL